MENPERVNLIITVDGSRPMGDVARDLRGRGFNVGAELDAINNVTGWIADRGGIDKLRSVRGVQDVSEDHPVDVGPPDSSFTW